MVLRIFEDAKVHIYYSTLPNNIVILPFVFVMLSIASLAPQPLLQTMETLIILYDRYCD